MSNVGSGTVWINGMVRSLDLAAEVMVKERMRATVNEQVISFGAKAVFDRESEYPGKTAFVCDVAREYPAMGGCVPTLTVSWRQRIYSICRGVITGLVLFRSGRRVHPEMSGI